MKSKHVLFLCLAVFFSTALHATVRYVKADGVIPAAQAANATSWATACNDLQAVMNASTSGDAVWVAAGTYKPAYRADNMSNANPNDRNNAFVLVKDVKIYGGFAGTESNLTDRDWVNNLTTLSGDIGTENNNTDNCLHVVISVGDVGTATLDGFTVTGGNANASGNITINGKYISFNAGGGMYNDSSPTTITNCTFSGNNGNYGGGMCNIYCSATIDHCAFSGNKGWFGAGMCNTSSSSPSSIIIHCTFSENSSLRYGGGMHNNYCSPTIIRSIFSNNTSKESGGGIYNEIYSSPSITNCMISGNTSEFSGGGIYNEDNDSPTITNCIISGNKTGSGGGIYNYAYCFPIITNCTISGNVASVNGGGIVNNTGCSPFLINCTLSGNVASAEGGGAIANYIGNHPILHNTIILGNSSGITGYIILPQSSLVQDLTSTANGNISAAGITAADVFVNPQAPGLSTAGDYSLKAGSPVIDKGNNALYDITKYGDKDLAGNLRIINSIIDLGAYEMRKLQTITVTDITKTYGDADFILGTAVSGLPLSYASNNTSVATVVNGQLHIIGAGTAVITASQAGNTEYAPAPDVTFTLTVNPKTLTVTADAKSKTYGQADPVFTYNAVGFVNTDNSSLFTGLLSRDAGEEVGMYAIKQGNLSAGSNYSISYTSADLTITKADITGITFTDNSFVYDGTSKSLTVSGALPNGASVSYTNNAQTNAGVYTVTAKIIGGNNYNDKTLTATLTITKADITGITFTDNSFVYDGTSKSLTIGGALPNGTSVSYTNNAQTNAGVYTVTAKIIGGNNYNDKTLTATLTITKAAQTLLWQQELVTGCNGEHTLQLTATASSGLPVNYSSGNNSVATVNNNTLTLVKPGFAAITASQTGNGNYQPAQNLTKELNFKLNGLIRKRWKDAIFFDNSSNLYVGWQWYQNGQIINGATQQYYSQAKQLNGEFTAIVTYADGSKVETCPLLVTPNQELKGIYVIPNPVTANGQYNIETDFTESELQNSKIVIMSSLGVVLQEITDVHPKIQVRSPQIQGVYIVRLTLQNGNMVTVSFLVK